MRFGNPSVQNMPSVEKPPTLLDCIMGNYSILFIAAIMTSLALVSSYYLGQREAAYKQSKVRVINITRQLEVLDDHSEPFAKYYPSKTTGHWRPREFPLVDWQDRVPAWLSSLNGQQSEYRWGEKLTVPIAGEPPLLLSLYPLWVDMALGHEGKLLDSMESAWALNAGGIENRGCQISRTEDDLRLNAQCLFTLIAFSLPE